MRIFSVLIISILFSLPSFVVSQSYQLDSSSIVKVIGSSNLRDWTAVAGIKTLELEGEIDQFSSVLFSLDTKSLEGGRGESMDAKIYKALKSTTNQFITFSSKMIEVNGEKISAEGDLTIAGHTEKINLNFEYQKIGNQIQLIANIPLKMSTYGVDPPTALFGQIVAKDDITIDFTLTLSKK